MGRIKSIIIKRTARELVGEQEKYFDKTFEHNKKVLGSTMPSKRMRNKIAGYMARLKKNKKTLIDDDTQSNGKETK
jgi:small subunit ribosomal protein S17e